jgi:DNA-binding CsgD family transcriptional regulator
VRAVTLLVRAPPEADPASAAFGDPGYVRERIQHAGLLDDGTVVLLTRVRGDPVAVREAVAATPGVLAHSVSPTEDGGALVYVHLRPHPAVRRFVELPRRHEVFFEFPAEATRDGRFRLRMVGESNAALGRALANVPREMSVEVERFGPYRDPARGVLDLLTDRQREVLTTAAEMGYYEVPRRVTHRDVAERLGLAVGTVSEHLQKAEARVVGALVS